MNTQNIKFLSFPVPTEYHTQLKVLASLRGITYKALVLELTKGYLEREENQKILLAMK